MSLKLIDLSHPLVHGQASFPGDPALVVSDHCTIALQKCQVSRLQMGSHQGTHLDAMSHFLTDGKTIDQIPLDWFYGPARLLRIPKRPNEEITVSDFQQFESWLTPGAKILYETGWHKQFGAANFFTDYPSLTLDAARFLAAKKIRLLGMDTPTPSKQGLEAHHILLGKEAEIVLVEGLASLDTLPEEFIFIGFPLHLKGRDGSPIRAVALCE